MPALLGDLPSERLTDAEVDLIWVIDTAAGIQREADVEAQRPDRREVSEARARAEQDAVLEAGKHAGVDGAGVDEHREPEVVGEAGSQLDTAFDDRATVPGACRRRPAGPPAGNQCL